MPSPWSHERAYWRRQPGPPSLVPLAQAAPGATGQAAERTQLLSGSLTALATPFQNDRIAEKAFAHFVNWQIEQGAQGLVVCSATGEGATLTLQERSLVIQIAVETTAGRIPIVAATGVNCPRESVALTRAAQAAGATAALIVAPYYNKPSQEGLYRHYYEIARSVDLPLIVENDPSRNGVDILPETLARLAEIPNIVGVESATGDLDRLASGAHSMRQDFVQLSGDDDTCVLFRMAGGRRLGFGRGQRRSKAMGRDAAGERLRRLGSRHGHSGSAATLAVGSSIGNKPGSNQICADILAPLVQPENEIAARSGQLRYGQRHCCRPPGPRPHRGQPNGIRSNSAG